MNAELPAELMQASLAITAALVAILAMRRPLRLKLGARAAYAGWTLAPLCMFAVLVPAPSGELALVAASSAHVGLPEALVASLPWSGTGARTLLVSLWAMGALLTFGLFARQQSLFNRMVQRRSDLPYDHVIGHGPAVTGLLRPRVVLPADFHQRYTRDEQALVLAHEQQHLRRGDIVAQAMATLLRCVFWFNPLVHYAAALFRFDQELACDADVLASHPYSRRLYGDAMLKTQLADFGLPIGCHWQSGHPLKERIIMLKHPLPGATRRISGLAMVMALVATSAYGAWAAQPAASPDYNGAAPVKANQTADGKSMPGVSKITQADDLTPPVFPEGVAKDRTGKVMLNLLVTADGKVQEVKVESSDPAGVFDAAAIEAASRWHFSAASRNTLGKKVEGWVRVPVWFTAPEQDPTSPPAP